MLPKISEDEFLSQVIRLARLYGWLVMHQRPSINQRGRWMTAVQGNAGFPDLVLCGKGRTIFAELKVGRNRTTPEQEAWLSRLRASGQWAEVWRPENWDAIEHVLQTGNPL